MQIPILIEPSAGNRFQSRGGELFSLEAEGATQAEVISKLQNQLRARLRAGAQLLSLNETGLQTGNPWIDDAGLLKDDPYFNEWQEAIAANRQKIEDDESIP